LFSPRIRQRAPPPIIQFSGGSSLGAPRYPLHFFLTCPPLGPFYLSRPTFVSLGLFSFPIPFAKVQSFQGMCSSLLGAHHSTLNCSQRNDFPLKLGPLPSRNQTDPFLSPLCMSLPLINYPLLEHSFPLLRHLVSPLLLVLSD